MRGKNWIKAICSICLTGAILLFGCGEIDKMSVPSNATESGTERIALDEQSTTESVEGSEFVEDTSELAEEPLPEEEPPSPPVEPPPCSQTMTGFLAFLSIDWVQMFRYWQFSSIGQ